MIVIRKCTPDDLEELQKISRKTYNETFAHLNSAENMRIYLEESFSYEKLHKELLNDASSFYFLYFDDKLAGYLKLNEHSAQTDLKDPQSIEIERIYISSEFQRKGLGRVLINKAIEIAKQKDKSFIWLGVWEKNNKALQFYNKNGFYEIGKHSFYMGDEEQTDFIMKKEL